MAGKNQRTLPQSRNCHEFETDLNDKAMRQRKNRRSINIDMSPTVRPYIQREPCVAEIADASPDVIPYACLVALMAGERGEHHRVESLIAEQLATGEPQAQAVDAHSGQLHDGFCSVRCRGGGGQAPARRTARPRCR
jgi:hypothetical protein